MSEVSGIFNQMGERFDADAAADVDEIFQFDIDDEYWHAIVEDGACQIIEGEHDDPSVTLSMDAETLQEVMSGETDGMQAFMAGRIKATGNMMLATQLTNLFPVA